MELKLSKTEIDLYCPNTENCREQIILRISYFTSRNQANIVGLSRKLIEKFVDLYGVKDIFDLYDLPFEDIVRQEGFGMKSVTKLKASIQKARNQQANKFLSSLGVEGIGQEISDLIIQNLFTKEGLKTK
jgi:DNA ligase (NAD+)